ncbi:hypothetical protein TREES_T100011755 [Tupaia chinensis]|uniref:Uncharacterized protein n=1 Tax=Tupaia chinensis TaxID=246437 RepID=L9KZ56_TUPCH|nr:hypothetical protein TREES_T100011755 [Tupaia chinensis]
MLKATQRETGVSETGLRPPMGLKEPGRAAGPGAGSGPSQVSTLQVLTGTPTPSTSLGKGGYHTAARQLGAQGLTRRRWEADGLLDAPAWKAPARRRTWGQAGLHSALPVTAMTLACPWLSTLPGALWQQEAEPTVHAHLPTHSVLSQDPSPGPGSLYPASSERHTVRRTRMDVEGAALGGAWTMPMLCVTFWAGKGPHNLLQLLGGRTPYTEPWRIMGPAGAQSLASHGVGDIPSRTSEPAASPPLSNRAGVRVDVDAKVPFPATGLDITQTAVQRPHSTPLNALGESRWDLEGGDTRAWLSGSGQWSQMCWGLRGTSPGSTPPGLATGPQSGQGAAFGHRGDAV